MLKKGLIFGLIGFVISFVTVFAVLPEQESNSEEVSPLKYNDGINGWISFGNILAENIREAYEMRDDFYISMFVEKVIEEINLSNKPELIITEENKTIFWTNGSENTGTKYTGFEENNRNFLIKDSQSIIEVEITSNNEELTGYLYLIIQNEPNPKEFFNMGWQYYGYVLATSNTLRDYVNNRNSSGIRSYIDKVTKKQDLNNLTILSDDNTVIWDRNSSNIGKKMQNGWMEEEKGKKKDDRFYFSQPVTYQGSNIADVHILTKVPVKRQSSFVASFMGRLTGLFKFKYLMIYVISFVVLYFTGNTLSRAGPAAKMSKASFKKSSPGLQNKIQQLKEEVEKLESTKDEVMEEVAKKQKVKKDLENEIEQLKTQKESIPAEAAVATEVKEGEAVKEEEKSEEELLFDNLLGNGGKGSAQKKEELELTQRIVAKRREEIALSGKIETRRKELMKLEENIEKLKNQK